MNGGVYRYNHLDVSSEIPCEMKHRHDAFVEFEPVPLVPLDGKLVLMVNERSYVPRDVVAPADRLHPVNAARIYPDQVTRLLEEAIHWYMGVAIIYIYVSVLNNDIDF